MGVLKLKYIQLFIVIVFIEVMKVICLCLVGFFDGQVLEIDVFDFDDDWDQFVVGWKVIGSIIIEINYDVVDYEKIEVLYKSGEVVDFLVIVLKLEIEGVDKLEVVVGVIMLLDDVVFKQFKGFVQNFVVQVVDNDIWKVIIIICGFGVVIIYCLVF